MRNLFTTSNIYQYFRQNARRALFKVIYTSKTSHITYSKLLASLHTHAVCTKLHKLKCNFFTFKFIFDNLYYIVLSKYMLKLLEVLMHMHTYCTVFSFYLVAKYYFPFKKSSIIYYYIRHHLCFRINLDLVLVYKSDALSCAQTI